MKKIRVICTLLVMLLLLSCAACGSKEASQDKSAETTVPNSTAVAENTAPEKTAASTEPAELSIFFTLTKSLCDRNDNVTIREIERLTNTKITCIEAPTGQGIEKLSILVAGNQVPDIVWAETTVINKYGSQGLFINYKDVLDTKMPNAKAELNDEMISKMSASDGKLYALSKIVEQGSGSLFARQDWMKKLGLSMPKTLDDYYNMIVAFRDRDPDGNGKNDTFGIAFNDGHLASGPFGLPLKDFVLLEDGTVTYSAIHPNMKKAWEFAHKLYADGLIDPEYTTLTGSQVQEKLINEQYGMWYGKSSANMLVGSTIRKNNPEKTEAIMVVIDAPAAEGVANPCWSYVPLIESVNKVMYTQGSAISAASPNQDAAIALIDWMYTEEGETTTIFGKEGETYTMVDGKPTFVEALRGPDHSDARVSNGCWEVYMLAGVHDILADRNAQVWDELTIKNIDATLANAGGRPINFVTPLGESIQTEVNKTFDEFMVQAVLGSEGIDSLWDKWVAEFNRLGGNDWIKEVNEAYKNIK